MADDLTALSRAASDFLAPGSNSRITRLVTDLNNGIANATSTKDMCFNWGTSSTEPLLICSSRQYKGGTADFDPLSAEIEISYKCFVRSDNRILAEGVTVIRIKDPTKADEEKVFHFDVEVGGWHEMVDGTRRDRAGHPAFHMQFYGMVNDIPRLPSLIVHPVDVISLAILELHQKKWRDHLTATRTKSLLRKIPSRQRVRFSATLDGWRQRFDCVDHLPIVGMQVPFREPLAL